MIDQKHSVKHHKNCPLMVSFDRFHGSCNALENPVGRICAPNKMENINLKVFTMIKGINKKIHKTYFV